jgi:hypothetical protein
MFLRPATPTHTGAKPGLLQRAWRAAAAAADAVRARVERVRTARKAPRPVSPASRAAFRRAMRTLGRLLPWYAVLGFRAPPTRREAHRCAMLISTKLPKTPAPEAIRPVGDTPAAPDPRPDELPSIPEPAHPSAERRPVLARLPLRHGAINPVSARWRPPPLASPLLI